MSTLTNTFHIGYVQSNGLYMKIQKSEDNGFQLEEFQELQMKMIQANRIPRLVPISFEEKNGEINVFYRIEGLRKLRNILSDGQLTMQDFYTLFINIIQCLQDANNNMLSEEHYMLHEDFIYVGNGYHQVNMTYLPLKDIGNVTPFYDRLKQLLLNIASEIHGINGNQFKMILNYIKDPGFSLQGLKNLLQDLQGNVATPSNNQNQHIESNAYLQEETIIKQVKKLPPLRSKEKVYSILISLLLIAASWKLSEDASSSIMLLVSVCLTIIIVAGLLIYWFGWRPGVEPIITEKEVKVTKPSQSKKKQMPNTSTVPHQSNAVEGQSNADNSDVISKEEWQALNKEFASALQENSYNNLNKNKPESDDYVSSDETTLLNEEMILGKPRVLNYLTKEDGEKIEKIELKKESIVVGRAGKGTDVVEKGTGVSRLHFELVKLSDTYGIKDLGSTNGTYVNDKKIMPYEIHELKHDDEIRVGKTMYLYKVEF
ncbi:DUF6382 domain-containing protein [Paucisalibacillus globulus]|uniref:DUF6382 domain-containing protein n=1 Tax=Paucisalibacillus globulus TaxID=351095 RepID=UPI000427CFAF|nr:DUF6382 domain-containing protein [Paucisalibacillus globulus]